MKHANNFTFLLRQSALSVCLLILDHAAVATTFNQPNGTDSLIDNSPEKPVYIKAKHEDSLIDIAVEYLLGQEEVVRANKTVDRWLPKEGTDILIPTKYILPDAPRQGIVINLPEYRLYYYPSATPYSPTSNPFAKGKNTKTPPNLDTSITPSQTGKVISYAVGIGRVDWKTPLGLTKVVGKVKNPTWTPPPAIRAEHLAKGDVLPEVWPAGPDNPLGLFAFRLGIPGYLLHSTNKPQGVGMQVSHGCMRLYPKDIEQMFPMVSVGTPVNIVNQPVKVGWSNGLLYIESHPNLEGEETSYQQRLDIALNLIEKAGSYQPISGINGAVLKTALEESNGLPTVISGYGNTDASAQGTEIPSYPPTSPAEPPKLESNVTTPVSQSEIEEELRREEIQEREFKNSPFPTH
jgi:L,D-transpeptidase ErfK/SrfK